MEVVIQCETYYCPKKDWKNKSEDFMFNYDEIKQNKTYIILTYIGTFKLVQMPLMAPSPFSFIILSSLSTARNKEFHLVAFGRSSWREQASSTVSAARVDLPHLFQSALHFPNVERYTFLYASLDVAFMASTVAIRLSRWQAQRWCCGSWNSKPSSSFRSPDTSTNSTSSSPSSSSSSSPGWDALPGSPSLPTALLFSSTPKTWKAFMKLEPLSVVVRTIFPRISNSEWMSFRALANTSNVCEPLSCLQARAAEHLLRLLGSIQWPVTPMKLRLLADQQSVVVAIWSTPLMASVTAFFIPMEASSIMEHRVRRDIIFALGCSSFTKSLNGCCSTTWNGWSPWTTNFMTALSMDLWDTALVFTSVVCLRVEVVGRVSGALFLFLNVSSSYFLRWPTCFLWNSERKTFYKQNNLCYRV